MSIPAQTRQYVLPKCDGFHNLTLREAPLRQPKANEVLVKIHAVSLNNRDLQIAKSKYPLPVKDDVVPTSDLAGEVVAVGSDVQKWKAGDRVCANFILAHLHGDHTPEMLPSWLGGAADGGLTEYGVFPAESLVCIPDYLSWEEASTLPCAALTAYNALHGATPMKGGDWVLVQGTGGVSIFALQIAVASGANVIATSSSNEKLELAKKLGARHTINYKTHPDWEKEVQRLTGGRGVDHVVEVGGPGTFIKSLESIRQGGSVYVIGYVAGTEGETALIPIKVLTKAANVRGILIGSVKQFEDMNRLFEARQIRPVIDKVFGFEQAQDAYRYLESGNHVGKVVIRVSKQQ